MAFQPGVLDTSSFLMAPAFTSLFANNQLPRALVHNLHPFLFQTTNLPALLASANAFLSHTSPVTSGLLQGPTLTAPITAPAQDTSSSALPSSSPSPVVKAAIVTASAAPQAVSALTGSKILKAVSQPQVATKKSTPSRGEEKPRFLAGNGDEKRESPLPQLVTRKRKQSASPTRELSASPLVSSPSASPPPTDTAMPVSVASAGLFLPVDGQRKLPERKRRPNSKFDSKEFSTPTSSPPSSPDHQDDDEIDVAEAEAMEPQQQRQRPKPVHLKRQRVPTSSSSRLFSGGNSVPSPVPIQFSASGVKPHKPHVNIRHVDQLRLSGALPQRRRALSFSEDDPHHQSNSTSTRKSSRVGRDFQADIPELSILRTLRDGSWDIPEGVEDAAMGGVPVHDDPSQPQNQPAQPQSSDPAAAAAVVVAASSSSGDPAHTPGAGDTDRGRESPEVLDAVDSLMNLLSAAASVSKPLPVPSSEQGIDTQSPPAAAASSTHMNVVASVQVPCEPPILPQMLPSIAPPSVAMASAASSIDAHLLSAAEVNKQGPVDAESKSADQQAQPQPASQAPSLTLSLPAATQDAPEHDDKDAALDSLEDEDAADALPVAPTPLSPMGGSDMCWPEAVRGIRKQKQKLQYLIKWQGFKTLSWEPADSFADDAAFQELVESFKQRRANRSRTRSRRSRYPRSRKTSELAGAEGVDAQ